MQLLFSSPAFGSSKHSLRTTKGEEVQTIRKHVAGLLDTTPDSVRLFALGKMLMDKCADGTPARLYGTYNIKENTTILVQFVQSTPEQDEGGVEEMEEDIEETTIAVNEPSEPLESYDCKTCHNDSQLKECRECGCQKCLLKSGDPLICDQCDNYWHMECANLTVVPTEKYWYCPNCINTDVEVVIGSGKSVDMSKTKFGESPGAKAKNWGGGVSCSGRQAECVIVPPTHVGTIPGIYCGQTWLYRISASEWGVHRSPVGGISGTTKNGAVSIVLSGGYEDDKDSGNEFIYTGSGGRDLEGNKRNGKHSGHQELTRFNLALAVTCASKVNDKTGGEAADWKKSRPVRVCRTYKLAKHNPKYAPEEGVRYDGLYKVVKYWPDKGASGFNVWRFLLRRDDPEPAPWTTEGKALAKDRGLRMIMPDRSETKQVVRYNIPRNVSGLMDADEANKRVWDELRSLEFWSEYEFLHYLFSTAVVCSSGACHVPIMDPITTSCGHIACKRCLQTDGSKTCFSCRADLSQTPLKINTALVAVLKACNWAYGSSTLRSKPSGPTVKSPTTKSRSPPVDKPKIIPQKRQGPPRRDGLRKVARVSYDYSTDI